MTDLQSFTLMMVSAQVVETSVNTNNSPSQDYTTNPDDHSNHNIDSPGLKPFTVINKNNNDNKKKINKHTKTVAHTHLNVKINRNADEICTEC